MKPESQTVEFDPALLNQYNQALPRYTSYPPATELSPNFDQRSFQAAIAIGNHRQITARVTVACTPRLNRLSAQ